MSERRNHAYRPVLVGYNDRVGSCPGFSTTESSRCGEQPKQRYLARPLPWHANAEDSYGDWPGCLPPARFKAQTRWSGSVRRIGFYRSRPSDTIGKPMAQGRDARFDESSAWVVGQP